MVKCPECLYSRAYRLADGRRKCRQCGRRFRLASAWSASFPVHRNLGPGSLPSQRSSDTPSRLGRNPDPWRLCCSSASGVRMSKHSDSRDGSVPPVPHHPDRSFPISTGVQDSSNLADSEGTVFASDFSPTPAPYQSNRIGEPPDPAAGGTHAASPFSTSASKLCVVCGSDCSKKPRVRNADGRYACRSCFERTRLHRAAASVLTTRSTEAVGGTPAPEVCSAIHQTLSDGRDDEDADSAQIQRVVSPGKPQPSSAPTPVRASFFRRAIDAFLDRSAGDRAKPPHR